MSGKCFWSRVAPSKEVSGHSENGDNAKHNEDGDLPKLQHEVQGQPGYAPWKRCQVGWHVARHMRAEVTIADYIERFYSPGRLRSALDSMPRTSPPNERHVGSCRPWSI